MASANGKEKEREKVFRDNCIQGDYIRLSPVSCAIIDTVIFQRLRFLAQLGMTQFVYQNATHTRFAHSLGVAHRAREMARRLKERQPELVLTARDLIVLEVAGLVHDLGHGPFSHSFETELVPKLLPPGQKWEHELMSCCLFDYLCQEYRIELSLDEQTRVKDLILGDLRAAQADWAGREWHFDIVANKRNGLDVDKLDYLKRDNAACGELTTSEFSALYENMRVLPGREGHLEVCYRSAVRSAILEVYSSRAKMHEFVYTHPVAKAVEFMLTDALLLVAEELRIGEALHDPERFALLDDTIVRDIERSASQTPGMLLAKRLIARLRLRDIYKIVASVDIPQDLLLTFPKVTVEDVLQFQVGGGVQLAAGDVRIQNLKIDFTAHNENPVESVGLWDNEGDEEAYYQTQVPFSPGTFITRQVRCYLTRLCESPEEKAAYQRAAQAAFTRWKEAKLPTVKVVSPQKSTLTASARKRQRPESRRDTTAGSLEECGGTSEAAAGGVASAVAGPASAAAAALGGAGGAAAGMEGDEDDPVGCSQSGPAQRGGGGTGGAAAGAGGCEPAGKRQLQM